MKAWHFSENAYPYLPPADEYESIRVSLPNRIYDPKKGAALYDRYIDEWLIAEDEGVEIMLNEHHQTATCVDPAAPLVLAALARLTKKARLLIGTRPNVDVAVMEELTLVAHRSVVTGPGLDDEVDRLPLPLVHANGIAVCRQHLIGHAAHETAFEPAF